MEICLEIPLGKVVVAAIGKQLRQQGLCAPEDILALRVFCVIEQFSDDRKITEAIKTYSD